MYLHTTCKCYPYYTSLVYRSSAHLESSVRAQYACMCLHFYSLLQEEREAAALFYLFVDLCFCSLSALTVAVTGNVV